MTDPTWHGDRPPPALTLDAAGWGRAALRGAALATLTFGCLALLLLCRLVERPLFGDRRPWTPSITRFVCRNAFRILGMGWRQEGRADPVADAIVSNHVSWLDIFALNAAEKVVFVAKAEVAGWPGIGWLARANDTLFIRRRAREAAAHRDALSDRLARGQCLLFFPEGTSSDGRRVLPFRPTLFAALEGIPEAQVQPVTLVYVAPEGREADFYGWWGTQGYAENLLKILGERRHGAVVLRWHAPVAVRGRDRKRLAQETEAAVRSGLAP